MKFVVCYLLLIIDVTSTWKSLETSTVIEGNLPEENPYTKEEKEHLDTFFCPDRCVCSLQEKIIDCSSLGFDHVPSIPKHTSRL